MYEARVMEYKPNIFIRFFFDFHCQSIYTLLLTWCYVYCVVSNLVGLYLTSLVTVEDVYEQEKVAGRHEL